MIKPFSLLIKPASADCNLRCEYCFYLGHSHFYPETTVHRMSDEVLERLISSYMSTDQPTYFFGWQGGEPTLMGVDFFERVIELQKKYGKPGVSVANSLQTNATLINDKFAQHLAAYNFLVGVSVDGPVAIHDKYRVNAASAGSHAAVMAGIECLKRNKVEFNTLTLMSQANADHGLAVYQFLRDKEFFYQQYIPCVEYDDNGNLMPYAIRPEQFGKFYCDIFDEWYAHDTRKVSIRLFDSILSYLVDNERTICHMGRNCCQYFLIEYNGDIYPCDFFVQKDLRIGNIAEISWEDANNARVYKSFGGKKSAWNHACEHCEFCQLCSGDCLKHRIPFSGESKTLSTLCEGWKVFYRHSLPGFKKLAERIKKDRIISTLKNQKGSLAVTSSDRNAPCPCGSGKKYKKCCGAGI